MASNNFEKQKNTQKKVVCIFGLARGAGENGRND